MWSTNNFYCLCQVWSLQGDIMNCKSLPPDKAPIWLAPGFNLPFSSMRVLRKFQFLKIHCFNGWIQWMSSMDVSVESDGKGRAIGFSVASSPLPGWPWLDDLSGRNGLFDSSRPERLLRDFSSRLVDHHLTLLYFLRSYASYVSPPLPTTTFPVHLESTSLGPCFFKGCCCVAISPGLKHSFMEEGRS